MKVWDGVRPLLKRNVLFREQMHYADMEIVASTENLSQMTDWQFEENRNTFVIHLGGELTRLECEFSTRGSTFNTPSRGDIWVIPADCRYAALAQGDYASFVEIKIAPAALRDAELSAQICQRDDFLHAAAERMAILLPRITSDVPAMAAHAIGDAMRFHIMEKYGHHSERKKRRKLTAEDRKILSEFINDQLDGHHSLSSLAALVNMDVRMFTMCFRESFGMTPWQYVMRSRLAAAAKALALTERSITEIALEVGFATPSHFATAFTRQFGATPSRYRANFRLRG